VYNWHLSQTWPVLFSTAEKLQKVPKLVLHIVRLKSLLFPLPWKHEGLFLYVCDNRSPYWSAIHCMKHVASVTTAAFSPLYKKTLTTGLSVRRSIALSHPLEIVSGPIKLYWSSLSVSSVRHFRTIPDPDAPNSRHEAKKYIIYYCCIKFQKQVSMDMDYSLLLYYLIPDASTNQPIPTGSDLKLGVNTR
jgi:hypothetical protein